LPEVPTLADVEGDNVIGFVVSAGTPKDVIALLNRETVGSLATSEMQPCYF